MAKKKVGRPSAYSKVDLEQVEQLCRLGFTDAELANFYNVTQQTINNWKNTKEGFFDTIKKGKELSDVNVADSLYKRALGFVVHKQSVFKCRKVFYDEEGRRCEEEVLKTKDYFEQVPPDTTACIYWLNNRTRKTGKWSNKPPQETQDNTQTLKDFFNGALGLNKNDRS